MKIAYNHYSGKSSPGAKTKIILDVPTLNSQGKSDYAFIEIDGHLYPLELQQVKKLFRLVKNIELKIPDEPEYYLYARTDFTNDILICVGPYMFNAYWLGPTPAEWGDLGKLVNVIINLAHKMSKDRLGVAR